MKIDFDDGIISIEDIERPRVFTPRQLLALKKRHQLFGMLCAAGFMAIAIAIGFLCAYLFGG